MLSYRSMTSHSIPHTADWMLVTENYWDIFITLLGPKPFLDEKTFDFKVLEKFDFSRLPLDFHFLTPYLTYPEARYSFI